MNRRDFVRRTVALSVAAKLSHVTEAEVPAPRRNLLYVFGDQHRACSMPGKPYSPVVAPTFEAFARQNFVMENCISNYPLCSPHRGILVSGRWPQQTGVIRNGPDIALPAREYGLGQAFKDAGYSTAYVGKWHLYNGENHFVPPGPLRFGFDHWRVWGNTNKHYDDFTWNPETGVKEVDAGWAPVPMTDQAIEFIGQQTKDKPWMMVVSWNPPHPPFNPPAEDAQPYPQASLPLRPKVALTRGDGTKSAPPPLQSEAALREAERGYYGGITGIDKQFQRLLDALDTTGQAENTIVVYTSDHGEMMGTHCRMAKQVPWEESCHVPFYVRLPHPRSHASAPEGDSGHDKGSKPGSDPAADPESNPGHAAKDLMGSIDIYPTLCGLAGIPAPEHCAGRDLSRVMRGERMPASEAVILMNESNGDGNNPEAIGFRGIRTLTHTYAVAIDGRWLLYDNVADPYQQKNLATDPAQEALMDRFDHMIAAWQTATGDTFPLLEAVAKLSKQPA